jgi:ATP-binding cassette, subfamily B, bacterial IrtB/YbtQ
MFVPFMVIAGVSGQFRMMEAALDRYEAVLKTAIIDEDGRDIPLERFDVEFDHVTFGYGEDDVLKDISFKVPENSMTALVGKSGCGKTTIANLVARFWDVRGGSVRIGGVDVRSMTCDSLLKNISMVFQNVYLFNDTVYNNVVFGKPQATRAQVEEACKKARCHEFIMQLPQGYDTVIGEGGSTMSGGEKQRISIARAILKDAPIVLLDEATASIDPDNEAYIQQAISEMVKGKTLIVIAHKLTSVIGADQILMIEDGEIVEYGNHAGLLKNNGPYSRLWEKRMKSRSWSVVKV